jgi:hypothetical protein
VLNTNLLTWSGAEQYCNTQGGHLATYTTVSAL